MNDHVHTFYYSWYGNPEHDGSYSHWNHQILPHWVDTTWNHAGAHTGGDDIGANFYPALGNYSSNDTSVIKQHITWMKEAGIGVVVITWWGKGSYVDHSIKTYLDLAHEQGLTVTIHIEPFYTTPEEFKEQVEYLAATYGNHPGFYKYNGKPLYYVYDSYKLSQDDWQKVLTPEGALTVRNTPADATFIGLWVEETDGDNFFAHGGFDGFYTYFASEGFVYGSTTTNWPHMAAFAKEHNLIFIPCVGPGYKDTRIRPWNAENTKSRENGAYYEKMFSSAINVNADFIGITSFNEWHEGTQIEPSIPKSIPGYTYEDFGAGNDSLFYIRETRKLVDEYTAAEK